MGRIDGEDKDRPPARHAQQFLQRVRTLTGDTLAPDGAPRIPGYRVLGVVSSALEEIKLGAISLDQVAFTGKFTVAAPPAVRLTERTAPS